MFTQCPHCHTHFQVTAEQLKAAAGDVRCGQCLAVFNALDYLSEQLPDKNPDSEFHNQEPAAATASPETNALQAEASEFPQSDFATASTEANTNAETINQPDINAAEKPLTMDASPHDSSASTREQSLGDIEDATADLGIYVDTQVDTQAYVADEDFTFDDEPQDELPQETPVANEAIIIEPEDLERTGFDVPPKSALEEESLAAQAATEATPVGDIPEPDKPTPVNEPVRVTVVNNAATIEAIETDQQDNTPSNLVPVALMDDLRDSASPRKATSRWWAVGSIVLMLSLALQVIYFTRDELAKNPQYRPWLAQACAWVGCTLATPYDIHQIEIIGNDVRSHPTARRALIASTTLINNAPFTQPYPLLTLTFSDMTGTRLAQRRFTPHEYLSANVDIEQGMPIDTPIQIELELIDPGKRAVNFEFQAEADPRVLQKRS